MLIRQVSGVVVVGLFSLMGVMAFLKPDWLYQFIVIASLSTLSHLFKLPQFSLKAIINGFNLTLLLILATSVVAMALFNFGPSFIAPIDTPRLIKSVLQLPNCILPMGWYGAWGLILLHNQQQSRSVELWGVLAVLPPKLRIMLRSFYEAITRASTMLGLTLLASSVVLLINYALTSFYQRQFVIIPFLLMGINFLLLCCFGFRFGRRLLRRLRWSLFVFYSVYIIGLVLLLWICINVSNTIFSHYPELIAKLHCQQCVNYFGLIPLETRAKSMYVGWWLIWTPLVGSYLAKQGQAQLITQMLVGMGIFLLLGYYVAIPNVIVGFEHYLILGSIGGLILYLLLRGQYSTKLLTAGFMPTQDFKCTRINAIGISKITGLSKIATTLLFNLLGTLFLYLTAGWYGIQVQVLATGSFILMIMALSGLIIGYGKLCHLTKEQPLSTH